MGLDADSRSRCIAGGRAAPGTDLYGPAIAAIEALTLADLQALMPAKLAVATPAAIELHACSRRTSSKFCSRAARR